MQTLNADTQAKGQQIKRAGKKKPRDVYLFAACHALIEILHRKISRAGEEQIRSI